MFFSEGVGAKNDAHKCHDYGMCNNPLKCIDIYSEFDGIQYIPVCRLMAVMSVYAQ